MPDAYTPIDCGIYDHLEIHAMRGTRLDVDYRSPGGEGRRVDDVVLVTIRQEGGEEVAVFRGSDEVVTEVRLDRLRILSDRTTGRRLNMPGGEGGQPTDAEGPAGCASAP